VLELEEVRSAYGRIEALHGVSLEVRAGEIVTLVGANGAGKTTLLKAISGVQPITGGRISFAGEPLERVRAHARVALGIAQVPEGRQLFTPLSVEDNLLLGAWARRSAAPDAQLARVYALFPMLAELRRHTAGSLSGGQQQMLAVGRALMAKPRLLLLDEPSMGLAPRLVGEILGVIERLRDEGVPILLVEQNARAALAIADRGYVLETGRVTVGGAARDLLRDERVKAAYLGM